MFSWEVICVEVDPESEFDDCRSIESIGVSVADSLRRKKVDSTAGIIRNDLGSYHVTDGDRRIPLRGVRGDEFMYVRTLDEDSPSDPLLDMPRCETCEASRRWEQLA